MPHMAYDTLTFRQLLNTLL